MHIGTTPAMRAAVIGAAAMASCLAAPASAQAQARPFRFLVGVSAPRDHRTGADDFGNRDRARTSAVALHLAYDLPKKQQVIRGRTGTPPLILSAYYDYAAYEDDLGSSSGPLGLPELGSNGRISKTNVAYRGFGAMLRAPQRWGYAGAGLGLYQGGVGGKVFVGVQGRSSLFAELSWTLLARPTDAGSPAPVLGIGLRL